MHLNQMKTLHSCVSSNEDDRRIFWWFQIFDCGIFFGRGGGRKIWQLIFGRLDLSSFFGGFQNNLKICGSACL